MIKIANGDKLHITQDDLQINGWAIECRICSEDPSRGFLPSSGQIIEYHEPKKLGVRVDSGIVAGSEISMYYDSMIAKLCTLADTREEAIKLMKDALGSFVIRGISHNISFLEALISHEKFAVGDITTEFIKNEYPKDFEGAELTSRTTEILLSAGLYIFLEEQKRLNNLPDRINITSPNSLTRWIVSIDDNYFPLVIRPIINGYHIRQSEDRIDIQGDLSISNTLLSCIVNGAIAYVKIQKYGTGYILNHSGTIAKVYVRSPRVSELESFMKQFKLEEEIEKTLLSPLSGQIIHINHNVGDKVKKNQDLITLVAMKMQNFIKAPLDGTIKQIYVEEGQNVISNQKLVEIE